MTGWLNNKCKPHMRLDIGSGNPDDGEIQAEGFVLNDIEPHKNIDLVCDIRELDKFVPKGYCSEIRASHVLEHFTTKEVKEVLKLIYTLLEPNGKFNIIVPNFRWHVELALSGNDEMAIKYAFGGQKDKYDLHKTAFTTKILAKYLTENGFKVIKMENLTSIVCLAQRN